MSGEYELFDCADEQQVLSLLQGLEAEVGEGMKKEARAAETTAERQVIGLNVTQPYKGLVADWLKAYRQRLGKPTPALMSINTLYRDKEGLWAGASTDGVGFARALDRLYDQRSKEAKARVPHHMFSEALLESNVSPAKTSGVCRVIGAGGAVWSILEYLDHHQKRVRARSPSVEKVIVELYVRDTGKPLKRLAARPFDFIDTAVCSLGELKQVVWSEKDVLVQASSAPLHGDDLSWLLPGLQEFSGVCVDLVYGKPSAVYTDLLRRGFACQDGLPMLIEQALASQQLWLGRSASYQAALSALQQD